MCTTGCSLTGDVSGRQGIENKPNITVNVPQQIDPEKLKGDIESSLEDKIKIESKSVQNQMSGMLNVAEARLADKVTGVEASIRTDLKSEINSRIDVATNIRAQLADQIATNVKLQTELNNQIQISNDMKVQLSAQTTLMTDLRLKVEGLSINVNAQVGINNKLENRVETLSAGHDINYLPKEAVEIMVDRERSTSKIIAGILGMIMLAITVFGKFSRQREQNRTLEEREERRMMFNLLLEVLTILPASEGSKIQDRLSKITKTAIKKQQDDYLPDPQEPKDTVDKKWWQFWR